MLEAGVPACILVPSGRKYKQLPAHFALLMFEDGPQLALLISLHVMRSLAQNTILLKFTVHPL